MSALELEKNVLPINDGTHVQADVLKSSNRAFLHSMQISRLVVHYDGLHATLEEALRRREKRLEKIPCEHSKPNTL